MSALALSAFVALLASCGGEHPRASIDDAPDASIDAREAPGVGSARQTVATVNRLVAGLPNLAARFEPARDAWELQAGLLTSSGFRMGGVGKVGVRLASQADGALRVGLGQDEAYTVTLAPEGAREAAAVVVDGRVVYRDAFAATDVVFVAREARVEWMYLLHDESAPTRFAYAMTLPSGLPSTSGEASGQVAFLDTTGRTRLRISAPLAVDASGTRREGTLAVEGGALVVSLDTKGLRFPVLLDPAVETGVWENRTGASWPPGRSGHSMAYDAARGNTVLFGGWDSVGRKNDTWTWDGSSWTQAAPATAPAARVSFAMAYDSARQEVVLFGGSGSSTYPTDTWVWNGSWTLRSPAQKPSYRMYHAMAYDAKRARTVLFGGMSGSPVGDTWLWDGTNWTQANPATSPPARLEHSMAYDAQHERVVLFGGGVGGSYTNDTWLWDGTNWTQANPATSPSPRAEFAMAYDSVRKKVVLFGGQSLPETWEWDGTNWAQTATTGPAARYSHAMAFDSTRARVVLFGGSPGPLTYGHDTWEYHTRGGACSCAGPDNCAAPECDTGYCVDGVCCDAASLATTSPPNCATCARCDSVAQPGACATVTNASDPDTCTAPDTCGPSGLCGAANGQACTAAGDCASGFCADGVCCNTDCAGGCDACNGATRLWSGAVNGTCATAPAAYAGAPTCTPYQCNGVNPACPNPCSSDVDCVAGYFCDAAGSCVASKAKGASCDQAAGQDCKVAGCRDCVTGNCVDGVCCESGCGGACQTCAATPGTCTTVTNADDVSQCAGQDTCDAAGACKKKNGQSCGAAGECASGFCADGYCCNGACSGGCDVCNVTPGSCTTVVSGSAGADPSCAPYLCGGGSACPTSCAKDGDCAGGGYCDASGHCVAQKAQGAKCDLAAGADCKQAGCHACSSGNCVDGFCCNSACTGSCNRCDGFTQRWAGGTDGTCATAPPSYPGDPDCGAYTCTGSAVTCNGSTCSSDSYCGSGYYCDATGHCSSRKGKASQCDAAAGKDCLVSGCRVCTTGNCVDGYCCDSACDGPCDVCSATKGTCTSAAKGSPGEPLCALYLCPGAGAWCGTSCNADADCATNAWCRTSDHTCQADQSSGDACTSASQCGSGYCVDGVCCSSACDGLCVACAATLKESGTQSGTCGPAKAGSDPRDDCSVDGANSCDRDGTCDGKGACRLYEQGTSCGATSCTGNLVAGDVCDGFGECKTVSGQDCAPYTCRSGSCSTPCATDDDCTAGNFCDATTCVPKLALGHACTTSSTCGSGFCVDGICCSSACDGTCQACRAADKESGVDDGTCAAAKVGLDPHDDCPDDGVASCDRDGACNGKGACRLYAQDVECLPPDCGTGSVPTTHACDGNGTCVATAAADCKPNVCVAGVCETACTTDGDCANDAWCEGGVCKAKGKNGDPCTRKGGCASNICADGVCCNAACASQCEACAEPGSEGTCTPVTGKPRGGRAACTAGTAENVCAEATCDGTERTACAGHVGSSVECRAASCAGGIATVAAKCDGKGGCPAEQTVKCEPYTCAGDACGKAPCAADSDCSDKFRCDGSKHDCVPRDTTTCSTDGHTQNNPDGTTTDCAPYACVGNACKTDCNSIDDCASPNVCDGTKSCIAPRAAAADEDGGGCGCRVAGESGERGGRGAVVFAALAGLALVHRRRAHAGLAARR